MVSLPESKSNLKQANTGKILEGKLKVKGSKLKKKISKNPKIMRKELKTLDKSRKKSVKINSDEKDAKKMLQKKNVVKKLEGETDFEIGVQISSDGKNRAPKKGKKSLQAASIDVSKKGDGVIASVSLNNEGGKEKQGKDVVGEDPASLLKKEEVHKAAKKEKQKKARDDLPEFHYQENKLMTMYEDVWVRRKTVPKLTAMAEQKASMIRQARETGKEKQRLTKAEELELSKFMARKKRTEAKKLRLVLIRLAKRELKSINSVAKKKEPVIRQSRSEKRVLQKEKKNQRELNQIRRRLKGQDPFIIKNCCDNVIILNYLMDVRGTLMTSGLRVSEQKKRLKMAAKRAERIFKEKGNDLKLSDLQ